MNEPFFRLWAVRYRWDGQTYQTVVYASSETDAQEFFEKHNPHCEFVDARKEVE